MTFFWKLVTFWAVVAGSLFILRRNSRRKLSQIAFSWHGPFPRHGESYAHFMLRWATYSGKFVAAFGLVLLVFTLSGLANVLADSSYISALFTFAIPLGSGMALLAAVGFLIKAPWFHFVGPSRLFNEGSKDFEIAA